MTFWGWIMSLLRSLFGTLGGPSEAHVAKVKAEPPLIVPSEARVVTVKPMTGAPDVRHFDLPAINDYIERNVSILRPGEHVALVVYGDMKDGQIRSNAALVGRLKKPILGGKVEWTVYNTTRWSGNVSTEVGAGFRWSA